MAAASPFTVKIGQGPEADVGEASKSRRRCGQEVSRIRSRMSPALALMKQAVLTWRGCPFLQGGARFDLLLTLDNLTPADSRAAGYSASQRALRPFALSRLRTQPGPVRTNNQTEPSQHTTGAGDGSETSMRNASGLSAGAQAS